VPLADVELALAFLALLDDLVMVGEGYQRDASFARAGA
jgi:hypothetical protein